MADTPVKSIVQVPSPTDLYNIDHLLNEQERKIRDDVHLFVQEHLRDLKKTLQFFRPALTNFSS